MNPMRQRSLRCALVVNALLVARSDGLGVAGEGVGGVGVGVDGVGGAVKMGGKAGGCGVGNASHIPHRATQ